MSSSSPLDADALASSSSSSSRFLQSLGHGYAIAVALAVLVLLSAALLASYACWWRRSRHPPPPAAAPNATGVALPRIIFVAEDDDDSDGDGGLDPAAISSFPKFTFSGGDNGGGEAACPICLCDYREGEMMRMLPDCRHRFHLACVDAWLRLNPSCPVCRTSPMPTPLSTPLSELVPLSHFPAGRRRRD